MMYPQNNYYNPYAVKQQDLNKVNGMESARAFPTFPNSTVALFDSNDDVMYIKSTDANNFPTIRRFRFIEEPETPVNTNQYVTLEEFNKFKEELLNAKQFISTESTAHNEQYSANKKHNEFDKKQ